MVLAVPFKLLHSRGAFHNPLMTLPVTLPPVGALLLASVAVGPPGPALCSELGSGIGCPLSPKHLFRKDGIIDGPSPSFFEALISLRKHLCSLPLQLHHVLRQLFYVLLQPGKFRASDPKFFEAQTSKRK